MLVTSIFILIFRFNVSAARIVAVLLLGFLRLTRLGLGSSLRRSLVVLLPGGLLPLCASLVLRRFLLLPGGASGPADWQRGMRVRGTGWPAARTRFDIAATVSSASGCLALGRPSPQFGGFLR